MDKKIIKKTGIKDIMSVVLQETFPYIKRKFSNTSTLYETFIDQNYKWLCSDLKPNTVALDIGANIGDSAIYFAMHKEIVKVYSYEPFASLYSQAIENIKRAGFQDKVTVFQEGLGGSSHYVDLPTSYTADVNSSTSKFRKGKGIKINTLEEALKRTDSKNIIIKADCEGAENEIFTGKNDLARVYRMQIEYHYGRKDIAKRIEAQGFKVNTEAVEVDLRIGEWGWIHAERK